MMSDEKAIETDADEANEQIEYQHRDMSSLLAREVAAEQPDRNAADPGDKTDPAAKPTDKAEEANAGDKQPDGKTATPAVDEPTNWAEARKVLKETSAKNKQLERQVEELTRKVMHRDQDKPNVPDPIADPEGYDAHQKAVRFEERVDLTRELMIDAVGEEKFTAAEAAFLDACRADTSEGAQLRSQIWKAPNPARLAFIQGSKILEARQPPVDDRAKLREELKAEILAELGHKPAAQPNGQAGAHKTATQQPATRTPTSLADARSVGSNAAPTWAGPPPLSSLIGPKRK